MNTKKQFVAAVLSGVSKGVLHEDASLSAALPGGFADFGFAPVETKDDTSESFGERLLRAVGLVDPQHLDREEVILGDNPAARSLPERVLYWPKAVGRPHHILLFELQRPIEEVLEDGLFRDLRKEQRGHDAVHRLIQYAQQGFSRGGVRRGASVIQGQPDETLIAVSIRERVGEGKEDVQAVHFGTVAPTTSGLESFFVTDDARRWARNDRILAEEHLGGLYERHFRHFTEESWQDAFLTGKERKLARDLLDECAAPKPEARAIQQCVAKLIREIGKSFGRHDGAPKLVFDELPGDHFIGADPVEAEKPGFRNPFEGITVRDDTERLLGYVIYCLDEKKTAARLQAALREHNSFDNVLVIYPSDHHQMTLELWQGTRPLLGKLTKGGAQFLAEGQVVNLLSRFFVVSKSDIDTPQDLARALARRARYLRLIALGALRDEDGSPKERRPIQDLFEEFDRALAHQGPTQFADAYAQTLTYGLLAARWMAKAASKPFIPKNVVELLPSTSPFLKSLFGRLIALRVAHRLRWLIEDLIRLLNRTSVKDVFEGQVNDPIIHFYEDFLDEYDPQIRKDLGVYYTPDEVVSYIVRTTHAELQSRFGLRLGLADTTSWRTFAKAREIVVPGGVSPDEPFVRVLDPATGTGTFLLAVIKIIHVTMTAEYAGRGLTEAAAKAEWISYVRHHLLPRINGFELLMAPYIVAHLRLGLALEQTGFIFGDEDRLHVFLTNTLEIHAKTQLNWLGEHVAEEAREAEHIKTTAPISVILGNPPYEREPNQATSHKGGWVRDGWSGWKAGRPLLTDYTEPVSAAGNGGHLKSIYHLYVYFWRWATWRVSDRYGTPGIVSLITASSFLRGPGFAGMREELRRAAGDVYVLDLEGDQLGTRVTDNVFCITIPVCVTTAVASKAINRSSPAHVRYHRFIGDRASKLLLCGRVVRVENIDWLEVSNKWPSRFLGTAGAGGYSDWPMVLKLLPWQQSGCKAGRTWVIGETREVLQCRWKTLVGSPAEEREALFKNSPTGQKAGHAPTRLPPDDGRDMPITSLRKGAICPPIERFGFRSFDRQWIFADSRVLDRAGPPNWYVRGPRQLYLTSLLSGVLGDGPGATVSAYVPDLHHFRGSYGGKDVIPLWRDPDGVEPNANAAGLREMARILGKSVTTEDLFAYTYAVLANPGYVRRFREELHEPGPRIPITTNRALFDRGAAYGYELLCWHTFGARFRLEGEPRPLSGDAAVIRPISLDPARYPTTSGYREAKQVLFVGDGEIGPVSREAWSFSVSGLPVIKSWLDYRMKKGAGKKSSQLDDIRPSQWTAELTQELLEVVWVLEWTCARVAHLDAWLEEVLESPLVADADLPDALKEEITEPKVRRGQQRKLIG